METIKKHTKSIRDLIKHTDPATQKAVGERLDRIDRASEVLREQLVADPDAAERLARIGELRRRRPGSSLTR